MKELRTWDRRVDDRPVSLAVRSVRGSAVAADVCRRDVRAAVRSLLSIRRQRAVRRTARRHHRSANRPGSTIAPRRDVVETRDDIVRQAAADAVSALARAVRRAGRRGDGTRPTPSSSRIRCRAAGGVLDWFFSRGPVPVGGDSMTVNKTTTDLRRPYATSEAASYRQILDVGAWDASLGVNTTGQSGHPRSPHYFDQNRLWRQGRVSPAAVHARGGRGGDGFTVGIGSVARLA